MLRVSRAQPFTTYFWNLALLFLQIINFSAFFLVNSFFQALQYSQESEESLHIPEQAIHQLAQYVILLNDSTLAVVPKISKLASRIFLSPHSCFLRPCNGFRTADSETHLNHHNSIYNHLCEDNILDHLTDRHIWRAAISSGSALFFIKVQWFYTWFRQTIATHNQLNELMFLKIGKFWIKCILKCWNSNKMAVCICLNKWVYIHIKKKKGPFNVV